MGESRRPAIWHATRSATRCPRRLGNKCPNAITSRMVLGLSVIRERLIAMVYVLLIASNAGIGFLQADVPGRADYIRKEWIWQVISLP